MSSWFVYIARCSDNSLYTGITNNLEKRIAAHNNKRGAKAVRGKLPVILAYSEAFNDKISAARRESEIKGWGRDKKLDLVNLAS